MAHMCAQNVELATNEAITRGYGESMGLDETNSSTRGHQLVQLELKVGSCWTDMALDLSCFGPTFFELAQHGIILGWTVTWRNTKS